ncbi:MAG TPA: Gfo/Idh/MocA family oxidoreductase [Bdellovibrionota bacterium]|jgi:predicted dehydrogenase|nr:Gfo/Idh/MocA family oxidoreductase [Bdellovibrionota bacterium]
MRANVFVLGSGRAARALTESLRILEINDPDFKVESMRTLARGASLKSVASGVENPILIIANPHGLHARTLLDADTEGFRFIVCEKPAAVSLAEIASLAKIRTPVAVCHGYRQSWGVQTLRRKIAAGEFGKLLSIEGRYWQSSAAQAALADVKKSNWKNDTALGGTSDALIDISSHWLDTACFLLNDFDSPRGEISLSYLNAEASHRDTHVHLNLLAKSGARLFASVSKTVHGAGNHFEVNVIGEKKSATWKFLEPDIIEEGVGATRTTIARRADEIYGSGHSPFHATGWLEGYAEILRQALRQARGEAFAYPTLAEHLKVLGRLLEPARAE